MKKNIIILIIFFINIPINAQKTNNISVLLFPRTEFAIIELNGKDVHLSSTRILSNKNDIIKVVFGEVCITNNVNIEKIFKKGQIVNLKEYLHNDSYLKNSSNLKSISKFMNKPSAYLPNLYNNTRGFSEIFPITSKVYDISSIRFYFTQDAISEMKFKLYLKNTDSLVCQTDNPSKKWFFQNMELERGKTYTWKLYNGSNRVKGEFTILTKEEIKELSKTNVDCKFDYLDLFIKFLENDCKFDAMETLSLAINKYPESVLFKSIWKKIISD